MPAMSRLRLGFAIGAWLFVAPAVAAAQPVEAEAHHVGSQRVTFGGEVFGVLGPVPDDGYFNYTGYERNTFRTARIRLFGEWRAADRLSIIGELRAEDGPAVSAPALYLRWQPVASTPVYIQAGRIPPLVGAFPRRAYGRDNAVIGLPLAYQYLTALRPDALPESIDDVLAMRGRGWLSSYPIGAYESAPGVPLVSTNVWDTGVEATWQTGHVDVSGAVTRGSPAVPVAVRDTNDGLMWSGRTTVRLPAGVSVGVSAARSQWLEASVLALTTPDLDRASTQSVLATDVEVGHGRWLVRAEWLRASFELPLVSEAAGVRLVSWSAFVETRFRPHPRWQLGTRIEQLSFNDVLGTGPGAIAGPWEAPVTRIEGVLAYRVTRTLEVRGGWQHNWRAGGRVREQGVPAFAVYYWF
jgi:hypothetical protein